jgi:hypothetical protein
MPRSRQLARHRVAAPRSPLSTCNPMPNRPPATPDQTSPCSADCCHERHRRYLTPHKPASAKTACRCKGAPQPRCPGTCRAIAAAAGQARYSTTMNSQPSSELQFPMHEQQSIEQELGSSNSESATKSGPPGLELALPPRCPEEHRRDRRCCTSRGSGQTGADQAAIGPLGPWQDQIDRNLGHRPAEEGSVAGRLRRQDAP